MSERLQHFFDENDVYLFGASGVGKTSLVKAVSSDIRLKYVSIGDITRNRIASGDIELEAKLTSTAPWDLTTTSSLILPEIAKSESYVLDGFPRKSDEAEWLIDHLRKTSRQLGQVAVKLLAPQKTVFERISARRGRCETPLVVQARVEQYNKESVGVLKIMHQKLDAIIELDADQPISAVINKLKEAI
jgi:adenylate kinase family enzyme